MSICLVALVVLGILSLFSARYRRWAREALDCVGRRVTLRPCRTGFNEKVRAKLTSKLLKRSPKAARFTYRNFEAISWVFTIILFVSIGITALSIYNLAVYGSCDPTSDTCIFNPNYHPICGNSDCTHCDNDTGTCPPQCGCEEGECES